MSISPTILSILKHLTAEPGVYRMKDVHGDIIYVGKAGNLKKRVKSYFSQKQQSPKNKSLIAQIADIEITVTRSEKEALLLECTLIKSLRPKYNIVMRDDKSFPYLCVQQGHDFPKMNVLRLKHMPDKAHYFGPYPNASSIYMVLDLLQGIFKLRNCSDAEFARRTRPCLQYQIKRCSGPCANLISKTDYAASVKDALRFLQGRDADVFKAYQMNMDAASDALAFEEAAMWRDKIKQLRMVQEQQAMICLKGDLDVIAIQIKSGFAGIIRIIIREGKVLHSEVFFPKIPNINWYQSEKALWQEIFSDFVSYYYSLHLEHLPKLIISSEMPQDKLVFEAIFKNECQFETPQRGQKKDWLNFAEQNLARAIMSFETAHATISKRYEALANALSIPEIKRMECFDISHTQGDLTVASCVVFDAQGPLRKDYRHFNIEGITPGDDYAAMRQVIARRAKYYSQEVLKPDLLIIDGGKGQVKMACLALSELGLEEMNVLGIAKGPGRKAGQEKLIFRDLNQEFSLAPDNLALHLLQHIRDEAHRFAITFHRQKRAKKTLDSSLKSIPGIGAKRHKLLLQHFGGLQVLTRASIEEIAKVPGISHDLAKKIFEHLH
ncbi:MAG: excinuclease ABC subunit UvrC [Gammaproteobacteria bacterium]|nr:excinuclease ABC subunit UvrC [Gammaproteobacteria bacterium]